MTEDALTAMQASIMHSVSTRFEPGDAAWASLLITHNGRMPV